MKPVVGAMNAWSWYVHMCPIRVLVEEEENIWEDLEDQ